MAAGRKAPRETGVPQFVTALDRFLVAGRGKAELRRAAAAAETRVKKKRYYAKTYAAQSRTVNGSGYYERIAEKLPYGSSRWWHQMDFENRGGR